MIDKPAPYPIHADNIVDANRADTVAVVAGTHQSNGFVVLCSLSFSILAVATAMENSGVCWTDRGSPSSYIRPPTASRYPPGMREKIEEEESEKGSPSSLPKLI